jgi:hypothetical protein
MNIAGVRVGVYKIGLNKKEGGKAVIANPYSLCVSGRDRSGYPAEGFVYGGSPLRGVSGAVAE